MAVTVAHVITKLELGGAQQNTLYTISHLDPSRYRRILVTGEPSILDVEARAMDGVEFHQIPSLVRPVNPTRDLRATIGLLGLFLRLKPTIVHTHSSKAGILGRWAAKLARVPIIIHSIHGFGFHAHQPPLKRLAFLAAERAVAPLTTRFFAVSEANRRQGVELGLFPADRCVVIRSGIDVEAARRCSVDRAAKKRELGFDAEQPVVGMVAPLKPQKAPLDFVALAALVHYARPETGFLLVGDGELRRDVELAIVQRGLTGVVRLAGWRRDVAEIMPCLTVFALTSRWEGLPRVYLEALAAGVPVVGTRVDGAAEVVRDGHNGYLVEPGDLTAMAERVLGLLNAPELARDMGQQGRALPAEFDIRAMVRQQEHEYERLLAVEKGWTYLRRPAPYDTSTKN